MNGPGPTPTQGSLIPSKLAVAHSAAMLNNTTSPQLQILLDAESISPRQATAMADGAYNMSATDQLASSLPSSKTTLLETVVEGNEAVLGSAANSCQAAKVGTSEHAEALQQQQQQQSSLNVVAMSTEAAVQLVQSSGAILEATVGQQSTDVQGRGSRQMSEDSVRGPKSTLVEVSSFVCIYVALCVKILMP